MQDLAPWPGIKPGPCALKVRSLSHWTTREVLTLEAAFHTPWSVSLWLQVVPEGTQSNSRRRQLWALCGQCSGQQGCGQTHMAKRIWLRHQHIHEDSCPWRGCFLLVWRLGHPRVSCAFPLVSWPSHCHLIVTDSSFSFFNTLFKLNYSWFTMLDQSLLYKIVTQLYKYTLFFVSFRIMVYHRISNTVPCLHIKTLVLIHSRCESLHLPTPDSQSIPLRPCFGNHKSVLINIIIQDICVYYFYFVLLATLCGMWNLSSPARDGTRAFCSRRGES